MKQQSKKFEIQFKHDDFGFLPRALLCSSKDKKQKSMQST